MVRAIILSLSVASTIFAVTEKPIARAMLTFAPGYFASEKATNYGLSGELEIYMSGSMSIRSDGYLLLGKSTEGGLKKNYQGFLGLVYNTPKLGSLSPFVGLEPGFALVQVENPSYDALRLAPLISPFAGMHFFSDSIFHFSFCVRYVYGEAYYPPAGKTYLGELRFTFGLGFNI
jgi:hypothetical protein